MEFGVWSLGGFIVDRVWGAGFRVSGLGAYDFGVWGDGLQARKGSPGSGIRTKGFRV